MVASGTYLSPLSVRVFISHSHEDNALCEPLLTALDAWGVDYWFDRTAMRAGDPITPTILDAITARDYFIRVVTAAVRRRPEWINRETTHFLGLRAQEDVSGSGTRRRLINLVLEPGYEDKPLRAYKAIMAFEKSARLWLNELREALQLEVGVLPLPMEDTGRLTPEQLKEALRRRPVESGAAMDRLDSDTVATPNAVPTRPPTQLLTRDGLPSHAFLVVVDTPQTNTFELPVGVTTIQRSDNGTNTITLADGFVRNCFESYPAGLEHAVARVIRRSMSRLIPA